jgi:hypothetical protein
VRKPRTQKYQARTSVIQTLPRNPLREPLFELRELRRVVIPQPALMRGILCHDHDFQDSRGVADRAQVESTLVHIFEEDHEAMDTVAVLDGFLRDARSPERGLVGCDDEATESGHPESDSESEYGGKR